MLRISLNKTNLPKAFPKPDYSGATSMVWKTGSGHLDMLTIDIYKAWYLNDLGLCEGYNETEFVAVFRGYNREGHHRVMKYPLILISQIPILSKASRKDGSDLFTALNKAISGVYSPWEIWTRIYNSEHPVLSKTGEWILNYSLPDKVSVDFSISPNLRVYNGDLIWYDPFIAWDFFLYRNKY